MCVLLFLFYFVYLRFGLVVLCCVVCASLAVLLPVFFFLFFFFGLFGDGVLFSALLSGSASAVWRDPSRSCCFAAAKNCSSGTSSVGGVVVLCRLGAGSPGLVAVLSESWLSSWVLLEGFAP